MLTVETIETPGLGDRSYLASDGSVAVVVDPQRDVDRVRAVADRLGVTITHVLETHVHNDYVSGGRALARAVGAAYAVAADEPVAFDRLPVRDGSSLSTGTLAVRVLATPGHTPHHVAYAVTDGTTGAVFTGGSMLYGTVGRTDLSGEERTVELTRAQWRSVRGLASALDPATGVHPTHGFGSFCSSTSGAGRTAGTIGDERRDNRALRDDDEDGFVAELLAGLTGYPRYYAQMRPANLLGADAPDLTPPAPVDPVELARRVDAGEWVVDLRDRRAFAREHVSGTVSVELGDSFATYLGWVIPWGTPLTVIGDAADAVAEAQLALARIGIDRLAGAATGAVGELADGRGPASYPVADFDALAAARSRDPGLLVLDVRRDDEWAAGHLDGARHVPLPDLEARAGEVPPGRVWVHCAGGFRAAIGASLLARAGRDVVHVDDSWDRIGETGLPVVR